MSSKTFSILGKNLKANTKADLEPYLSELEGLDGVEEVHFGGNSLGVEACQAIAEVLKKKTSLKVVDLADIFTGRLISEIPQALSALCDALSTHESLVELDLSDNAFGGRCADALVPFLTTNTWFQVFKLNNNGLGPWGGTVVANALLENAKKAEKEGKEPSLRVIVCGRNRLENGSATHWSEALGKIVNLEEIRIPQNGIRMEGIASLAAGLAKCRKLQVIDFQDNTATLKGTRAISKYLSSWTNLRELNLSDCLLGKTGSIALTTALVNGSNTKLEVLKLQYAEMDKRSVELLTEAISQHLKGLTTLELNGNRFAEDDECVEELKKALALWNHEDALDELDDMEEPESGEEDEEEEEEDGDEDEGEEEETTEKAEDGIDAGASDGGVLPPASDKQTDELADLLAGVHVQPQ